MGAETECVMRHADKTGRGRVQLETDDLRFRGTLKATILFRDVKSAKAADGVLRVTTASDTYEFDVGPRAQAWAEKILHPKSRIEKMGITPGSRALVVGVDAGFQAELEKLGVILASGKVHQVVVQAAARAALSVFARAKKAIVPAGGIWIVYPKGRTEITEMDVLEAGRRAGLKDVKVVRFSETHTGLKFVIPLSDRQKER